MMSAANPTIEEQSWLATLQRAGYRLTAPRRALVTLLAGSDRVLTAQQLLERAQQEYPELGMATVYRTLEVLEELGLVWRVHDKNGLS